MSGVKVVIEAENAKTGMTLGELSSVVDLAQRQSLDVQSPVKVDLGLRGQVKKITVG